MVLMITKFLGLLVPILLAVALLTLLERKVLGYIQFRKGPNLIGPIGLLQPLCDGLKLFIKENFKPLSARVLLFYISPVVFFFISLVLWGVIPIVFSGLNLSLSVLFVIAISRLSVYAVLGAGWSSNSKYSLLGAIRGVAQTISYEVSFSLIVLPLIFFTGGWGFGSFFTLQLNGIWLIFVCFPLFIMWYIRTLAETKRSPFDLTEGESELVSGYNVEYSGAPFALFFIGEYAKIILMKVISSILFFGGGSPFSLLILSIFFFSIKIVFLVFTFLWVRSSFPRFRYDQLMLLMWKGFLPFSISFLIFFYILMIMVVGMAPHY